MNYETVKSFGGEELETKKYGKVLDDVRHHANVVQTSLSHLNIGQAVIFSTGLTLNLLMAAHEVSAGTMTPGDFVMI